jgi:hypothetical protein
VLRPSDNRLGPDIRRTWSKGVIRGRKGHQISSQGALGEGSGARLGCWAWKADPSPASAKASPCRIRVSGFRHGRATIGGAGARLLSSLPSRGRKASRIGLGALPRHDNEDCKHATGNLPPKGLILPRLSAAPRPWPRRINRFKGPATGKSCPGLLSRARWKG